ncbi:hypothetical protein ACFYKX_25335 [Cytobacillus sp. FJAT-54145]|uniref:Conjugal transfer protein n=1 Tax=Cytobacillus spartinae TaxID=3299023 RepID=A0ABW6KJI4_9BACI
MKYRVPRNVKSTMSFMGLELKGWLLYLPTVSILVAFFLLIIPKTEVKLLGSIFSAAIGHVMFQTDEKTGVLNISLFLERIKWIYFSEKIIYPTWSEESERTSGLKITVQKERTRDTETRDSY